MKKIYRKNTERVNISDNLEKLNEDITAISEEPSSDLKISRKVYSKEKPKKHKSKLLVALVILLILSAVLGVSLGYFYYLLDKGKKGLMTENPVIEAHNSVVSEDGSSVKYKGSVYEQNENIVSFLIMGIDDIEGTNDDKDIGNKGQADTIFYCTLDTETGDIKMLNISRDSMVDVDLYDKEGNFVNTEQKQICLAYAYGHDDVSSCENVKKSASRLLFNAPIDFYVAIDFPAVSILTDTVDGVTVEVLEDLTKKDAALKKGETVTLNGKQSMIYVRSRDFDTLDSNNNRMQRQKQYVIEFLKKVQSLIKSKPFTVINIYQAITEYTTTDLDLSKILYLASVGFNKEFNMGMIKTVEGEVVEGEEYAEFHVDEDSLYNSLLSMLYKKTRKDDEWVETESETTIQESGKNTTNATEEKMKSVDFSQMY
jgi:LCP family protein required for cell wall assembly